MSNAAVNRLKRQWAKRGPRHCVHPASIEKCKKGRIALALAGIEITAADDYRLSLRRTTAKPPAGVRSERGRRLLKLRSELVERSFAHMYETGGMRRTHLRGLDKILKRLLIHAAAFTIALLVLKLDGIGKPRTLQEASQAFLNELLSLWIALQRLYAAESVERADWDAGQGAAA